MRSRVVLAVAALAFVVTPVAHAQSLPDLPGMGAANRAVGGRSASTSTSTAPAQKPDVPSTPATTSDATGSVSTSDAAKSLKNLPGTGIIPSFSGVKTDLTSSRSAIPGQDALVVLAALGSFAALGALYMLRRLGRI